MKNSRSLIAAVMLTFISRLGGTATADNMSKSWLQNMHFGLLHIAFCKPGNSTPTTRDECYAVHLTLWLDACMVSDQEVYHQQQCKMRCSIQAFASMVGNLSDSTVEVLTLR